MTAPNFTRGSTERTHLLSTGQWREHAPSYKDAGSITFSIIHDQAQYNSLLTVFNAESNYFWRVESPTQVGHVSGARWSGVGHITEIVPGEATTQDDDTLLTQFTVKLSGQPTYVLGS